MSRLPSLRWALILGAALSMASAVRGQEGVMRKVFGKADGQEIHLFLLKNANGMEADITNFGGIVTRLTAPDKEGKFANVVLGFDTLDRYLAGHPYFGAIIGRYANRIAKGSFTLEGKKYTLAKNNGDNHLHGGNKGFDRAVWQAKDIKTKDGPGVELTYLSKDGEEGYPGNLQVKVTYVLTNTNALRIQYHAVSDKATPLNLSHHSYFNLAGEGSGDILGHLLSLSAEEFLPVDAGLIPTGEKRKTAGTPFDFSKPTALGARIDEDDEQLKRGGGYDHCFIVPPTRLILRPVAHVEEPKSGRVMDVLTTEPGVQLYTGNFLEGKEVGPSGRAYKKRHGFCLETQRFPDAPNQPDFRQGILGRGETFQSTTEYRFTTSKK